ncbi:MAG: hypothetical protein RL660_2323 [Bacteroidota bacterium]
MLCTFTTIQNCFCQKLEGEFTNSRDLSIYLRQEYVVLHHNPEVCCNPATWDTGTYRIVNDTLKLAFGEIKSSIRYNLTFNRNGFHTRNRINKLVRINFKMPDSYYGKEKYQYDSLNFDKSNLFFYDIKGRKVDSLTINPWYNSEAYEIIVPKSTNRIRVNFGKGIKNEYVLPKGFNEFNITVNLNRTGTYGRQRYTREFAIVQTNDTLSMKDIYGLQGYAKIK